MLSVIIQHLTKYNIILLHFLILERKFICHINYFLLCIENNNQNIETTQHSYLLFSHFVVKFN